MTADLLTSAVAALTSGRAAEAAALLDSLLATAPDNVDAYYLRGLAALQTGDTQDAIAWLETAACRAPGRADIIAGYAKLLFQVGQVSEAERRLRILLEQAPSFAAHRQLAELLRDTGRIGEAEQHYCAAMELGGEDPETLAGYAVAIASERPAEAAALYRRALHDHSQPVLILANLALVLVRLGQVDEAERLLDEALAKKPDSPSLWYYKSCVANAADRPNDALQWAELAADLAPDNSEIIAFRGMMRLMQGRLREGFADYEARLNLKEFAPYRRGSPLWDGRAPVSRLTLCAEQGYGDAIQFVRYLPVAAERCGEVKLICSPALHRLFRNSFPWVSVLGTDAEEGPSDAYCPLISLAQRFGTDFTTIPAAVPYLKVDPEEAFHWQGRLAGGGLAVGLCWRGNPANPFDRTRSLPESELGRLLSVPGCRFYSLQAGSAPTPEGAVDLAAELKDFATTAAVMANLDLVISVDTAVAHLAGALGRPTWLLLRKSSEWRWMRSRTDSPWYPNMTLFRQNQAGNWGEVCERVAGALALKAAP